MDKVGHVAAALALLACPSRSARPSLKITNPKYILIISLKIVEIEGLPAALGPGIDLL